MDQSQARKFWQQAAEIIKDKSISPTLFQAVEQGVGITMDDDNFVLGFAPENAPMAGHLRSSQHASVIEQTLTQLAGRPLKLKVVDGVTLEDYEEAKRLLEINEQRQEQFSEKRERARRIEQKYEGVAEQITRGFAKKDNRQFAQVRGNYIRDCFELLDKSLDDFNYGEESDDVEKRALSRVFERLATVTDAPASILAYEFFKMRDERKGSKES